MSAYRDAVAGAISGDEVGSIFSVVKKVGKGVAKGVSRSARAVVRTTGKGVSFAAKEVGKGAKFAVKHPLLFAAPVAALHLQGGKTAVKAAKAVVRKAGGGSSATSSQSPSEASDGGDGDDNQGFPSGFPGSAPSPPDDSSDDEGNEDNDNNQNQADEGDDEDDDQAAASDDSDEDADDADSPDGESSGAMDEYIGLDEIAGEDLVSGDSYEVGADGTGSPPGRRQRQMEANPNAVIVRSKKYQKARRQSLGFVSSSIATTASGQITQTVQTLFRGRKLVVGPAIASFFTIDNLFVGTQTQFAVIASQSAESYLPTTTGEDNLTMDPATPGMVITLAVTNIDTLSHIFRATIFGNSVQ